MGVTMIVTRATTGGGIGIMPNFVVDRIRGGRLVGAAWLESDERFRIEYRRWRWQKPVYRVVTGLLERRHRSQTTEAHGRADLSVTYWPRLGMVAGGSYPMGKR